MAQAISTDLPLLVFLVLVLNVSLAFKLLAVVFIYALRPNFKFDFRRGRLPLFYLMMIFLWLIELPFNFYRGTNYLLLAALVLCYWGASLLILHQLKLAIEKRGIAAVERTLSCFFILNAIVSFWNLFKIMVETGSLNPYTFNGDNYKYSASTGDYIHGIMGDLSTANMIINAFALFYYLYRGRYLMSVLCLLIATYTTSNLGNIILFMAFLCIVLFDPSRLHKGIVLCYLAFLILFIAKVSPSNLNYLDYKIQKLQHRERRLLQPHFTDNTEKDRLINAYVRKYNVAIVNKEKTKQEVRKLIVEKEKKELVQLIEEGNHPVIEFTAKQKELLDFYRQLYGDTTNALDHAYYSRHPGKVISLEETFGFLKENPKHLILGAGPGNFSSKLAFKASNVNISGKYIKRFAYIAPEFRDHHLKLSLNYYLQPSTEHSIINFPNSVLNQLLGEYGVIGLLLFLVFYAGFYLRRIRQLSFGRLLLPLLLLFMLTDYWLESFTIVIVFELMMFIDLSRNRPAPQNP